MVHSKGDPANTIFRKGGERGGVALVQLQMRDMGVWRSVELDRVSSRMSWCLRERFEWRVAKGRLGAMQCYNLSCVGCREYCAADVLLINITPFFCLQACFIWAQRGYRSRLMGCYFEVRY